MTLSKGARLGPYEVVAPLGAGGMGEVYRATDVRLGRQVALKVLPQALADDPQYMARLEREAQTLASLNHPNIAALHGLEGQALVMELVEGSTLAERLAGGALPLDEALLLARQIAEGLEAAHERGVVHRDLKPENVKITIDGTVKLLDFGLAKAAEQPSAISGGRSLSPTLSLAMTQAGLILGTAAYMAPEQARGKPVDKRADIWAFGAVLYEMLAGRQLFGGGETVTDTLAAVVKETPDWNALPADTPSHIRRLLERCLCKDPKTRLRDIGEARITLDEGAEATVAPVPAAIQRQPWLAWGVAAISLVVAAVIAWQASRPAPPKPLVRLRAEAGVDGALGRAGSGGGGMLALSPDGTRLAVTYRAPDGKVRLGTRLLHQEKVTSLPGTDNAHDPFFSLNGLWVGFFADGKLKKVAVEGGAAVTLCDAPVGKGASWTEDGDVIAALDVVGGLSRIPASGGAPAPVTKVNQGERTHRFPQVLPGSRAVLFTASMDSVSQNDANIDIVRLETGERKTIQRGGFDARYLASGHLVWMHQGTLFAAPFDLAQLALSGTPVPVLEDVSSGSGGGDFAVSRSGTFVYVTGSAGEVGWAISWLDGSDKPRPLHAPLGLYFVPRLSPDGRHLAFSMKTGRGGEEIWVKDLERDATSRLSFVPGRNSDPLWSPDGKNIVFRSESPTGAGLYWIRSDGAGDAERLTDDKIDRYPHSFFPDGKRLAFSQLSGQNLFILTAPIEGDSGHRRLGKPEPFVTTPFFNGHSAFSPDGRFLAFDSNESGTMEVYVRSYPGPGGRWQISTGGGRFPRWSRGARELFFETLDQRIMTVTYTAQGDSFTPGKPRLWSAARVLRTGALINYDLAPDGKRLAAMVDPGEVAEKPVTQLTFLLDFFDELRRRAPVGGK